MLATTKSIHDCFERLPTTGRLSMTFERADVPIAEWQALFRGKLAELLRMEPVDLAPPVVELMETRHFDGYDRVLLHMHAADGVIVPFFMLKPLGQTQPAPGVLAIHGHGDGKCIPVDDPPDGYDRETMIVQGQRDYAVQAVRQGMVAVAPDMRGMGELQFDDDFTKRQGNSCIQMTMRALHCGRTLLGMRIADLMQLVSWMRTREDIDADRIVATGNSGGGTATLYLAAMDTRVTAAVPSCFFCTAAESILRIHHCPDQYVPDLQHYGEMWDVAGLIAPRPMLIVAGDTDPIFPIDGVRSAYAKLQPIYEAAEAAGKLELHVGQGGHRYFNERVWPFLAEHLGGALST